MWSTFRSKTLLSGNTSSSGSSTPKRSQSVDVNANRNVTEEPTSTIEDKASETGNSNESIGNPKKDRSHHAPGGRGGFINPWPSAAPSSTSNTGWLPSFSVPLSWGVKPHPELRRIKVVKPDFDKIAKANELKATWLGHAGVLVQLPLLRANTRPITLVIDPMFSPRASPSTYAGPAKYLQDPCSVEDLPPIDFCFISHNHYDHLDHNTIMKLIQKSGETTRFVVPLGLKQWFLECKVSPSLIHELDWWDEITFQPSEINSTTYSNKHDKLGSIRISCVPAQHNSARTGWDKCMTLWAGFVVEQFACKPSEAPSRTTVYFAGDTGYRAQVGGPACPAFEEIGKRYGPMDFSTIPIWRGGTLNFVSYMGMRLHPAALTLATHATPEDAVSIHSDVLSRCSMAMHYATFAGSEDEATYPIALLEDACRDASIAVSTCEDGGFGVSDVGETLLVPVRPDVMYTEDVVSKVE